MDTELDVDTLKAKVATLEQLLESQEKVTREQAKKLEDSKKYDEFLANATPALAESLDVQASIGRLARSIVPDFADWCVIDLVLGSDVRRVAFEHRDPSRAGLLANVE